MARNSVRITDVLRLPHNQVVEIGREVAIIREPSSLACDCGASSVEPLKEGLLSTTNAIGTSASTVDAIREKAKRLSILSMMATTAAGSGHPTSCLSAAELVAGTFFYAMKFDPKNPNSPDGDRFVLSKGHAAPVLYAAFAEAGVFPESRVMTLREFSSELEGHPTPRIPGVDAATGSLGQGLSVGAGLAIGAKIDESPTRVYVMLGDGEMAEGQVWEAAAFAGHYKLENLTVLADVNALGQSEPTMYRYNMEIYREKFEAEEWAVEVIDGHDVVAVLAALDRAKATKDRPQAILARTIKGHGVSFLAGKEHWHGKPIPKDRLAAAIKEVGGPIDVPADPGKSYARTTLPEPPNFPPPAAPEYDPAKPVGVWVRTETTGSGESTPCGDFRRRKELNVLRGLSGCLSRPFLSGVYRRTEPRQRRRGTRSTRKSSVFGHLCLLPFPRLRPGENGRDQPEQYQPLRVTLRSVDRRGWTFADGIGGYCDIPRGSLVGGVLPERCGIGGTSCGDDGAAAWNQLPAHVTAKDADIVRQGRKISGTRIQSSEKER
jgi:transketolase N-terminal domain/subunit